MFCWAAFNIFYIFLPSSSAVDSVDLAVALIISFAEQINKYLTRLLEAGTRLQWFAVGESWTP